MDSFQALIARNGIDVRALIATCALLVVGSAAIWFVSRFLRDLIRRFEPRLRVSYETALVLTRVAIGALWVLLGAVVLNVWGISVTGLWAFLVSAATVIGVGFLATWTMISNVTASVFIAIWRPFRLGETVEILPEALKGRAVDRNLMFTTLREEHGSILQIPNSLFFQKMFRVSNTAETYFFEVFGPAAATPKVPESPAGKRN